MRRVKRNPDGREVWRELAFGNAYQYGMVAEKQQRKIKRSASTNFISQCLRTSPGDAGNLAVTCGEWQQAAQGERSQCSGSLMEAIDRASKALYSYQHAWDCAAHLDVSQRQKIWERLWGTVPRQCGASPYCARSHTDGCATVWPRRGGTGGIALEQKPAG